MSDIIAGVQCYWNLMSGIIAGIYPLIFLQYEYVMLFKIFEDGILYFG